MEIKEIKVPTAGAIPSDPDYRDEIATNSVYSELLADIASDQLPIALKTEISQFGVHLDQNKISACVSHAWVILMKYYWWKKEGTIIDFSPRFLDILSSEPWIPIDGGRVPRTVCKVSASVGCCTTALLPNNTDTLTHAEYRDPNVITQAMRDEAARYKIPGYVRVPDNVISDFRVAIQRFGLVSGLFAISDAFWLPSWNKTDINPLRAEIPSSNHQMVVKGWDGDYNTVHNSWSDDWNDDGDGIYKASTWLKYIFEGWSIATIPQNLKEFMSNLPSPDNFHYQWNRTLIAGNSTPDEDVKMAQVFFMIHGFMAAVEPDELGYFGPKTQKAVLRYQKYKKISPTASYSIGPKTRAAMNIDAAL